MKLGCIIQARMGSTRLPGKVMMEIKGKPMLGWVIERAKRIEGVNLIIGAFPDVPESQSLIDLANERGVAYFLGSPDNVLARYYEAAKRYQLDYIMRITGDCPLIAPDVCTRVASAMRLGLFDYVSNDIFPSYPVGMGCEIFTFQALEFAHQNCRWDYGREHVFPFIKNHKKFTGINLTSPINGIADKRFTVDTQADLDYVRQLYEIGLEGFDMAGTLDAAERLKSRVSVS